MSKVDFTKPVRVNQTGVICPAKIIQDEDRKIVIWHSQAGNLKARYVYDGESMYAKRDLINKCVGLTIENIPEAHVDWSQGVLDNPLKVPWRASNIKGRSYGCYVFAGNNIYFVDMSGTVIEATKPYFDQPNQWPIPASALAELAKLTKDELPDGVELRNTIDDEQSSAYCFVDGKCVGMICHDSSLKTGFVAETLSEAAIYKHKRSSEATYTWSDLVRIRDEFRAKRKAEVKPLPKAIINCKVTTSGLAAEVGGK